MFKASSPPTSPPEAALIPRAYQDEILAKAMHSNLIAVLATGSGKTLIAALLIRFVASQPSQAGKKIFFLVPKVPLVKQQQDFISIQNPQLRLGGYVGEMGVEFWNKAQWAKEIEKHDVLVMTPAILVRLLSHAYITIPQISLLVFDEAHHGRANHPYAQIMRDHYSHCPLDQRPRVFGMTASPIWSPKNPRKSIQMLEASMDSKIISVQANKEELDSHNPNTGTEIVVYRHVDVFDPPSSTSLWGELHALEVLAPFINDTEVFKSLESRYLHTRGALGDLCSDRYLFTYLEEKIAAASLSVETQSILTDVSALKDRINLIRKYLDKHRPRFDEPITPSDPSITPKVWCLVELLERNRQDNLQAIVFAERRDDVKVLAWLLPKIPSLDWIRCTHIVGHGAADMASKGMTVKSQESVVKAFRDKKHNVIVASSVAEEGLDFQSLSLVIKFDVVHNIVSFAQSRGRARKAGSAYYAMFGNTMVKEIARFRQIVWSESDLMNWLSQQPEPESRPRYIPTIDDSDDEGISQTERQSRYKTKKGAILTYSTAIVLLNELCSLLPSDEFTHNLQPQFTEGFQVMVTLPAALPIPRDKLAFTGPKSKTKSEAKRAVAFRAVRELHKLGVFDDHLLPIREADMDEGIDADGRQVPLPTTDKMMNVQSWTPFDDPWKNDSQLWLHPVVASDRLRFGLVLTQPIVINDVLDGEGFGDVRLGKGILMTFASDAEKTSALKSFVAYNASGIEWGITSSKAINSSISTLFLVPLKDNTNEVNWPEIKRSTTSSSPLWSRDSHLKGDTILARHRRRHLPMVLVRIRNDLTPRSKPITIDGYCFEKAFSSYLDFYNTTYVSNRTGGPPLEIGEDDMMLEFRELKRARTVIKAAVAGEISSKEKSRTLIVPQSVACVIQFPLKMQQAFTIFPTLIRQIMGHTRAQEAIRRLKLPASLDEKRMMEALTLPLVCAGFDYQRLETMGDSCLKLATSVHVYNKYPHKHEGQLHPLRRNSISNLYLRGRAIERNLFEYVNGERVINGKHWRPPNTKLTYDKEDRPLIPQTIPRKAMQDCMEATLGVAWATGGMPLVLKTGTALDLCFGGDKPWSVRYPRVIRPAKEAPAAFRSIMDRLGYEFKDRWLLMEALTHPSCPHKETSSYNRLEFLGDALVDTFTMQDIFPRFPNAPPGKLTNARSAVVCNITLAAIAVKELSLDKCLIHANMKLAKANEIARQLLVEMSYAEIMSNTWRMQIPKALGDLTESVFGAVFVDSNYDLDKTFEVLNNVMGPALAEVHPDILADPTADLLTYVTRGGCGKVRFNKTDSDESGIREHSVSVLVHEQELLPPATHLNKTVARIQACYDLLQAFHSGELILKDVCTCAADQQDSKEERQVEKQLDKMDQDPDDLLGQLEELDEDTEEAFAVEALLQAQSAGMDIVMVEADDDGMDLDESVDGEPIGATSVVEDD